MSLDPSKYGRMKGSFIGLAIGDALGVPLEFSRRDSLPEVRDMIGQGPFNLHPGEWTDDTSMALCIAESLAKRGLFNSSDIMKLFCKWWKDGYMSHNGECFDIGLTTLTALSNFYQDSSNPYQGARHLSTSGNGAIMRLCPIPIFFHQNRFFAEQYSISSSRLTHASELCVTIAGEMGVALVDLYDGASVEDVIDVAKYKQIPRSEIKSTGYVVDTWEAAKWAISNTSSFEDALILAVNLAEDADTVGAVTGQLAGALYGYSSIPDRWLTELVWRDKIELMFDALINKSIKP